MHSMLEICASVSMGNLNFVTAVTSVYAYIPIGKKFGLSLSMELQLAVHAVQSITARSHWRTIDIAIAQKMHTTI